LRNGLILAYPTEAVWGLGCDPFNTLAVAELLALKNRPADKGMIVAFASFDQLEPFLAPLSAKLLERLQQIPEEPTTWLVPIVANSFPSLVTGKHRLLAVRITQHPGLKALCEAFGPLVSTSANPAGAQAAKELFQVRRYFGDSIRYYRGRVGTSGKPSKIKDLASGQIFRA
jgi:L-threonylcarbamoyladenylate synthase